MTFAEETTVKKPAKQGSLIIRFTTQTLGWVPFFIITIGVYLLMQLGFADMRAPIISSGTFVLTPVELLYVAASIISMVELLKVSNPGSNDQFQVTLMYLATIVNIVLFVIGMTLAAVGVETFFGIFVTSEFLVLTVFSLTQALMAGWLNAVTSQRTIGTGVSTHHD